MNIYRNDGRLNVPFITYKTIKPNTRKPLIIKEAYCPKGCSIIDSENKIGGENGLRIKFRRLRNEGIMILSAIEGDTRTKVVNGKLIQGEKDDLYCPHCDSKFEVLVNCTCKPGAEMVIIGLTPQFDLNNAITLCNVTGCSNAAIISSGEVIRRFRNCGSV